MLLTQWATHLCKHRIEQIYTLVGIGGKMNTANEKSVFSVSFLAPEPKKYKNSRLDSPPENPGGSRTLSPLLRTKTFGSKKKCLLEGDHLFFQHFKGSRKKSLAESKTSIGDTNFFRCLQPHERPKYSALSLPARYAGGIFWGWTTLFFLGVVRTTPASVLLRDHRGCPTELTSSNIWRKLTPTHYRQIVSLNKTTSLLLELQQRLFWKKSCWIKTIWVHEIRRNDRTDLQPQFDGFQTENQPEKSQIGIGFLQFLLVACLANSHHAKAPPAKRAHDDQAAVLMGSWILVTYTKTWIYEARKNRNLLIIFGRLWPQTKTPGIYGFQDGCLVAMPWISLW